MLRLKVNSKEKIPVKVKDENKDIVMIEQFFKRDKNEVLFKIFEILVENMKLKNSEENSGTQNNII